MSRIPMPRAMLVASIATALPAVASAHAGHAPTDLPHALVHVLQALEPVLPLLAVGLGAVAAAAFLAGAWALLRPGPGAARRDRPPR